MEEIDGDVTLHRDRRNWTNDEISAIISAVQQRPFLYDKRHADYKQNAKKDTAWEEIAAKLKNKHLTARECKRKWNTLRIQKRRIINQQGKKKGKHQVQWLFYDTLNFLMPHMEWPTYRDGSAKKDVSSDNEFDETSCGETYENFHPSFSIKKLEESLNDEDTHEQGEDTEEEHLIQEPMDEHVESSGITVSQVAFMPATNHQEHQQQTQSQQQQQQQQHELIDPLILPYHEIRHTAATQHHPSQQLIISRPVTITRYSAGQATQHESMHHTTVDSTAVASNQSNLPTTSIINSAVATSVGPASDLSSSGTNHTVVSTMPSSSGASSNRLDYFLLDVQQQMEKLNDIAQMELKVDMQKLLLDKLRQSDNYKLSRCD